MIPFRFSPTTSKIVCFARTFAKHAVELGNQIPKEPIFFLKAPSAYIGDGELIRLPKQSHEIQEGIFLIPPEAQILSCLRCHPMRFNPTSSMSRMWQCLVLVWLAFKWQSN
jgi:hypothetical protein